MLEGEVGEVVARLPDPQKKMRTLAVCYAAVSVFEAILLAGMIHTQRRRKPRCRKSGRKRSRLHCRIPAMLCWYSCYGTHRREAGGMGREMG